MTTDESASSTGKTGSGAAGSTHKLRGHMGTFELLFAILAFNGPLMGAVANVPLGVIYGNGLGTPVAYLAAGALIAVFASGFLKMSRHMENPGGFYSYVAKGLGREVGLGASLLAIACYASLMIGSYPLTGVFINTFVHDTLGGPNISWAVWAAIAVVVVPTFGHFNIEFSARTLVICMVCEAVIIVVYDLFTISKGGAAGLSLSSFGLGNVLSGNVGLALMFATLSFAGFEVSAIFRDEVRDPQRTIPRAAFSFIAVVGLGYALVSWVFIQAVGDKDVQAAATNDPAGIVLTTMKHYVGPIFGDVVTAFLCTSAFAALLSFQNVIARYLFNLGVDGILPERLGTVHKAHGSPYIANFGLGLIAAIIFACILGFRADPALVYAQATGVFGIAFVLLLILASVAVFGFMNRFKPDDTTIWHRVFSPALAFAGLLGILWVATTNVQILITGDTMVFITYGVFVLAFVGGVVYAARLKNRRPESYAKIGRQ